MNRSSEIDPPPTSDPTTVDDWWGLGDLLGLTVERVAAPAEGMQRAITDRWLGLLGPGAVPVRRSYHALTAQLYGWIRFAGSAVGTALGMGAALAGSRTGVRPLWRSPLGGGIQAAANALWGDELHHRKSHLGIQLAMRDATGAPISPDPAGLALAFPKPTARLAVLLHGLGETERCWQRTLDEETAGLADELAADSFTPLLIRYNTGRHVSDNGAGLAALVEQVMGGWAVPVEEIALIGHSMGGLVARSAIHAGRPAGHRWTRTARHVVAIGSPHLGAPLEKGVNLVAWGLRLTPESRPLGKFLDGRSVGIKDLRFGAIREEDRHDDDPDALLRNVVGDVPAPDGVNHHFVAGVVTAKPTHPLGALVGDLMVRRGSSTGRGWRRRVDATNVRVLGGRRHHDLLRDPVVHAQVREWLAAGAKDRSD